MKILLLTTLLATIALTANAEEVSIDALITDIKHSAFGLSPWRVDFTPYGKTKENIDRYCETLTDSKLLDLENELWKTDEGFTASGLIQIIGRSNSSHAQSIRERYLLYLKTDVKLFDKTFPNKEIIINGLPKPDTLIAHTEADSVDDLIFNIKHSMFAVDAGGVEFASQGKTEENIAHYCETLTDGKLLDLENELWKTDDGYIACGLIQIIGRSNSSHAQSIRERYRLYLNTDVKLFDKAFPGKRAIIYCLPKPRTQ
jgi:hypothetical protein